MFDFDYDYDTIIVIDRHKEKVSKCYNYLRTWFIRSVNTSEPRATKETLKKNCGTEQVRIGREQTRAGNY